MRDLTMTIEELSLSRSVSLGKCSLRTLYRWRKALNWKLARENYGWRVQVNKETMCLEAVDNS